MKIAGIIVEYNPLHNGHIYHIDQVRKRSNCDVLVAVMSGSFTQRGEPAIIDKFTRTSLALQHGIDLVIELPFVFAVQNADIFAKTSVELLYKIGVTDIYFGSESGSIEELVTIGDIMNTDEYNQLVKKHMSDGNSYPTASDKAMKEIHPTKAFDQPNNILGIQYILAGKELNSGITFHTIKRIHSNYYDEVQEETTIQSATAIRKLLLDKEAIDAYVPHDVNEALLSHHPVTYNDFTQSFQTILSRFDASHLRKISHVTEGLEHRIMSTPNFSSVDQLVTQLLTRRYTNGKIKRMLAHILCNVEKDDIPSFDVPYIRVLGMTQTGREYLNHIKHDCSVPLYTKIKEGLHPYLDIEIRVSKIYSMAADSDIYKKEFQPVIF